MPLSLILICFWVVAASLVALTPRPWVWRLAMCLIVTGIPLVGYVTWQSGPLWGVLALAVGASVLRWPLIHAGRWIRRKVSRGNAGG